MVTVCEGSLRDDSQGFWSGDWADEGDGSRVREHGRETNLMEEDEFSFSSFGFDAQKCLIVF